MPTEEEWQRRSKATGVPVGIAPEEPKTVAPFPVVQGEGVAKPLSFVKRAELGLKTMNWEYNAVTGAIQTPHDYTPEKGFNAVNYPELIKDLPESAWSDILTSVSTEQAEDVRNEVILEQTEIQRLMADGTVSGLGYMAAGILTSPTTYLSGGMEAAALAYKGTRLAKLGLVIGTSGAVTATETALLAKQKSSVDSEDVLHAALIGMAAGPILGKVTGSFSDEALGIQKKITTEATDQMDENLVTPLRQVSGEADETIYGMHDPSLQEVIPEVVEEGIEVVPVVRISPGKAMYNYINENSTAIKASVAAVKGTKTWEVLSRNPLMSDFTSLFKLNSVGAQHLATQLLENASGLAGRSKTASILSTQWQNRLLEKSMPAMRESFEAYAKERGIGIFNRKGYWSTAREDHFKLVRLELEKYRNASAKGVEYTSDAPQYIQHATDAWRKSMKEGAELAKANGVKGFDEIVVHDGYVPLLWKGTIINKLKDTPKMLKRYQKLLTTAYIRAGIDTDSAGKIAKAVFNRKSSQAIGLDANPGALLSKDSREFFEQMLIDNGHSTDEIATLFQRIDGTLEQRGVSGRAKGRVPLDLTVADGKISLLDIVDNDLSNVGTRYFTEMSGRSALARKGIRSDSDWTSIRDNILEEVSLTDPQALEKTRKILDGLYSQFLGQPVGEGVDRGWRRLKEWTANSMLGMTGLPQLAEFDQIIAAHGVSAVMSYIPELRAYTKAVKAGTADETLLGELQGYLGGMWDEHLFMRPEVRLEDATTGHNGWQIFDNLTAGTREYMGYASGMNQVKSMQQKIVSIGQANKVMKMLRDGTDTDRLLTRFQDVGWSPEHLNKFKKYIDNGTVTFQESGALDKLNLQSWHSLDVEDFTIGMQRHSAQMIQRPHIGETAYWQHKTLGAMLTQFRSFPLLAAEKQTARRLKINDPEAYMSFLYGIGISSMLYAAKVHTVSLGRPDRKKYLEKRLSKGAIINGALQWSSGLSFLGEAVSASAALGLVPEDWGTGSTGRSMSAEQFVPGLSVGKKALTVGAGITKSLSPWQEYSPGPKEVNAVFGALPAGNTAPFVALKNIMLNIPKED